MLARDPQRFTWRNFFIHLDKLHKFAEHFAALRIHPFRKLSLKKAEAWMIQRFEGSDGLAAIFPGILNSLIALKALGYPDDHPLVRRCEEELKKLEHETADSVRIEPCTSPGLGHRHRRHCPARIGPGQRSSRPDPLRRMAHGPRGPFPRRLAIQEPRARRTERLGL